MKTESPRAQLDALGDYIRTQRKNAELSLRELAEKTGVSNPYLSQLERGLHEPSMRVLSAIADALEVSIETLLRSAGLLRGDDGDLDGPPATAAAIAADRLLTDDQRAALLAVYQSYVEGNRASGVLDDDVDNVDDVDDAEDGDDQESSDDDEDEAHVATKADGEPPVKTPKKKSGKAKATNAKKKSA